MFCSNIDKATRLYLCGIVLTYIGFLQKTFYFNDNLKI